jgi:predicted metal-dependent phosphoesterase TrpH
MIVDLHTHSYYSDGVLSPKDIVMKAVNAGCEFFSLTDHDSIEGLKEASMCSKDLNLNFIQGVEISAKHLSQSIHIVGLGVNPYNKPLLDGLMKNNKLRINRAKEIGKSLAHAGIENAYEKTKSLSKTKYITRTHFAQMMIKEKICNNLPSVFKKYMTGNKPGAVKVDWASSVEVINWIHQSGGLAILAHPLRYKLSLTKMKKLVGELKEFGLDGIEIVNSFSSLDDIAKSKKIADEYELLYSCGSDFHGWPNQSIELGKIPLYDYGKKFVLNYL